MNEDYERLHFLDEMYLVEYQQEIEEDYYNWKEEQERLPASIEIIFTKKHKHDTKRKNYKENQKSTLL